MIKAIVFDLDGVYFVNGKENFIKKIVGMGVTEEEAKRVFLKSEEMNFKYKTGEWSDEEYWNWAIGQWGLKISVEEVIKLLIEGYELNNEVVETVKKVRGKGYKTLICSNNFPARVEGLRERFKFLDNFEVAVFSYEVGAAKPDKKIFEKLIEKSGCRAEEIIYADDNEINIKSAKELGINTLIFSGFEGFVTEMRGLGVEI